MPLQNFNIVLVGPNFPVGAIKVADFSFRHRTLTQKETPVPIILEAEARGLALQILPERFQATVTDPRDVEADAADLVKLVKTFFDYVGPKSITAVGHNLQQTIAGKAAPARQLLNLDLANKMLGESVDSTDVQLYSAETGGKRTRVQVTDAGVAELLIDVNVNYNPAQFPTVRAVEELAVSITEHVALAARIEAFFTKGEPA
ncbi:hypothetical protein SEA_MAGICMAN_30 [Gordonia phage MagicMan]|nr:hypothetical protein SEA_MAGICMAN_30 [Gordonia phage MagicMan]